MESSSEGDRHLEPGQRTNTTLTLTPTQMGGGGWGEGRSSAPSPGLHSTLLGNPFLTLLDSSWPVPGCEGAEGRPIKLNSSAFTSPDVRASKWRPTSHRVFWHLPSDSPPLPLSLLFPPSADVSQSSSCQSPHKIKSMPGPNTKLKKLAAPI